MCRSAAIYFKYVRNERVTVVHGGARNEEAWNFVWNTLFYKHRTEIAGEQVHTKMTLILDKDTGNTEDF